MPLLSNNIVLWRGRAEEARILAEYLDGEAKLAMFQVAAGYDRLVKAAEESDRDAKSGLKDSIAGTAPPH